MHITFKLFVPSGKKFEELRASEKRYVCPPKSLLFGISCVAILNIVPKC